MIAFSGLTIDGLVDAMWNSASAQKIDHYYNTLCVPKVNTIEEINRANHAMVVQLVEFLDVDKSGMLSVDEIKSLFSKLSGFPVTDIPDDHPGALHVAHMRHIAMLVLHIWLGMPNY